MLDVIIGLDPSVRLAVILGDSERYKGELVGGGGTVEVITSLDITEQEKDCVFELVVQVSLSLQLWKPSVQTSIVIKKCNYLIQ